MDRDIMAKSSSVRRKPIKPWMLEYGFWAFLLVAIGRLGELIPGLSSVPLGKIALAFCVVSLVLNWKQLPPGVWNTLPLARLVKYLLLLALLLTPFSFWSGGSMAFGLNELPVLVAVTLIAYKMGRSWRYVRGTMLALVVCGIALALSALLRYHGGRAATNTMYDTNDLAYVLVTVFPLGIGFAMTARRGPWQAIYWGIAIILAISSLLTESRGGVLGLMVELICILCMPISRRRSNDDIRRGRNKNSTRLIGIIVAACVGVVVWSHLPEDARTRFETLFNLGSDYNLDASDITGRREIWTRGFEAALKRPIGYGPNTFNMVDLKFGGHFMAPHNSFLEILVELGVVGLFLFLGIYFLAWRGLQVVRTSLIALNKPEDDDEEQIAFTRVMQIALLGNAISGFFLSMAYSSLLWVLVGNCMAIIANFNRTNGIHPTKGRRAAVSRAQKPPH